MESKKEFKTTVGPVSVTEEEFLNEIKSIADAEKPLHIKMQAIGYVIRMYDTFQWKDAKSMLTLKMPGDRDGLIF